MGEAERSWWLDADRTWRRGHPPAGWHQGDDGRWHAPDRTTEQLTVAGAPWIDPPAPLPRPAATTDRQPARHLVRAGDSGAERPVVLPSWMRVVVPALVAVVVLSMAGVVVTAWRGTEPDVPPAAAASDTAAAVPPGLASPSPTQNSGPEAAADATTASAPGETTSAPAPTEEPSTAPRSTTTAVPAPPDPELGAAAPSTVPADPLAACSTGQRNLIERGNHPWSWYAARFDTDGDGVLCT